MNLGTIFNAVVAALLAGGVAAIIGLARQLSGLRGELGAFVTEHRELHAQLGDRLLQLERITMERGH